MHLLTDWFKLKKFNQPLLSFGKNWWHHRGFFVSQMYTQRSQADFFWKCRKIPIKVVEWKRGISCWIAWKSNSVNCSNMRRQKGSVWFKLQYYISFSTAIVIGMFLSFFLLLPLKVVCVMYNCRQDLVEVATRRF